MKRSDLLAQIAFGEDATRQFGMRQVVVRNSRTTTKGRGTES